MDNRENLNPSSGDTIIKRHLFSEVAQKKLDKGSRVGEGAFVRRPNRQSFGFRVAASSGPILKDPMQARRAERLSLGFYTVHQHIGRF